MKAGSGIDIFRSHFKSHLGYDFYHILSYISILQNSNAMHYLFCFVDDLLQTFSDI